MVVSEGFTGQDPVAFAAYGAEQRRSDTTLCVRHNQRVTTLVALFIIPFTVSK